jgi:hypothetical protein
MSPKTTPIAPMTSGDMRFDEPAGSLTAYALEAE